MPGTLTLETRPGTADFTGQLDRVVSPNMQPANVLAANPRERVRAQETRLKENGERSERRKLNTQPNQLDLLIRKSEMTANLMQAAHFVKSRKYDRRLWAASD